MRSIRSIFASVLLVTVECVKLRVSRQQMQTMKVPIGIEINNPNDLNSAVIRLCAVNFGAHKQFPSMMPFFSNVVDASACDKYDTGESGPAGVESRTSTITVGQALAQVRREYGTNPSGWLAPVGVVTHMARCGSTAVANMFASAPNVVVLVSLNISDGTYRLFYCYNDYVGGG